MKKNKLTIMWPLGLMVILSDILILFNLNFLYIQSLISFFTYLFVPGILIFLAFKIKNIPFWEMILLIVGFSVAFLEFGGLLINFLFPVLGIAKPLSTYPLLAGFNSYFLILFLITLKRSKGLIIQMPKIKISRPRAFFYSIPLLFPILSVFGAIRLNNEGSNIITMIMLLGIGLYVLAITKYRSRIATSVFPYTLFLVSLSVLLMTSLRSWNISGHDIQTEYFVFLLTKNNSLWSMDLYRDAYNACLSITILPTVLFNLLKISDVYIYKLIYQIIFALSPVGVYLFLKRYSSPFLAFMSAFFYISFPTFFNDMPFLNRQEIAFLFFILLLLISFSSSISLRTRKILFLIFGFSVIVSHYSTNYVLLFIFGVTYLITYLLKIPFFRKRGGRLINRFKSNIISSVIEDKFLSLFLMLSLVVFTVFWNSQVTKTSGNVGNVIEKTIKGIFIHSDEDKKSGDVSYSLFFKPKLDPQQNLDKYVKDAITNTRKNNQNADFYSPKEYEKYKTVPLELNLIPLTDFGKFLKSIHFPLFNAQAITRQISAISMQVLIPIGLIGFFYTRSKKKYHKKYIILCFSSLLILFLDVALPTLSVEYGLLRMFQQLLTILSLPLVVGILMLTPKKKRNPVIMISSTIAVLFFLCLTGFFVNLTGGYYPQLNLNNDGLYYQAYYTHKQNIVSVKWLAENRNKTSQIQVDNSGQGKLLIYGDLFGLKEIFPPIIRRSSYVYLPNSNLTNAIVSIEANTLVFSSPVDFLQANKNLIYNDGLNRIYK